MHRNLDLAALRALVAVLDLGGVTRAAAQLNLTQSTVSMQIKRLEETLGQCLTERAGRGVVLTLQGEQLVGYARRLLALNDEIVVRMTAATPGGELRVGAPCDLIHVHLPQVMRAFAERHPDTRIVVESQPSGALRERLEAGALDLILTTDVEAGPGAETLDEAPLVWIGAPGGQAWARRPLPLATVFGCAFSRAAVERLSSGDLAWTIAVESSKIAVDGAVAADQAVYMMLVGTIPPGFEVIDHGGALPTLPRFGINMTVTQGPRRRLAEPLAAAIRAAYAGAGAIAAE